MSSFGPKRRARKITVQDDDDEPPTLESLNPPPEPQEPAIQPSFKSRKPFKQSSLRKSIAFNEEAPRDTSGETKISNSTDETEDQEDGGAPVRIRPSATKPGATKSKKRQSSSRLSFGPSEITVDDDDAMVLGEETFMPKKPGLAASATENSSYKKGIPRTYLSTGFLCALWKTTMIGPDIVKNISPSYNLRHPIRHRISLRSTSHQEKKTRCPSTPPSWKAP